jgi:hypothetical protein
MNRVHSLAGIVHLASWCVVAKVRADAFDAADGRQFLLAYHTIARMFRILLVEIR